MLQPRTDRPSAAAPQPYSGEVRRLQILHGLRLLDTPDDDRFDRVTRLAARLFETPIALVTLIDAERQWFKSRIGTDVRETDLALSFCAHALRQRSLMVVEDATLDPRFVDNPLVNGETGIRFYAGWPLAAPDGTLLGTLCVLDRTPRCIDADQSALLGDLAALVEEAIAAIDRDQTLAHEQERDGWMRSLLEHVPDGVLMLDEKGTILSMNRAAGRIFHDTDLRLVGHPAQRLMLPEDLRRISDEVPIVNLMPYEGTGIRADGSHFPLEFTINRLQIADRRMVAAIVRDVSARREHEERGRAVEARRRKQFATATHELRTPMASVLGFSELLLKREFDPVTGKELVEIIHRQANRLVALINQLLDLARIDAGGRDGLDVRPFTVKELVGQTLAGLEGLGESHRIVVHVEDGLPALVGDAAKLQQALTNILSNSIKYSASPTPIAIDVSSEPGASGRLIAIRVRDEGIGMTPDQQRQVFDAFYRADPASAVTGSGLGLTIFKEIIELHGGTVELRSTPGAGTDVTIRLPALSPDASEASDASDAGHG